MASDLRRRRPSTPADAESSTASEVSAAPYATADTPTALSRAKIDKSGLYDLQQIKRLLDDEIIAFMEDQGYDEAVLVSNVKIAAGTAAVSAALYSHFNPWEFPANRLLVLACVLFYGFCIFSISISSFLWENSAIFVGKLAPKARKVSKGSLAPNVWVMTQVGVKGSSDYKVDLRTAPRQKVGNVSVAHPYENYFTEEGRFLVDRFRADLRTALAQLPARAKKT